MTIRQVSTNVTTVIQYSVIVRYSDSFALYWLSLNFRQVKMNYIVRINTAYWLLLIIYYKHSNNLSHFSDILSAVIILFSSEKNYFHRRQGFFYHLCSFHFPCDKLSWHIILYSFIIWASYQATLIVGIECMS